jgi:uncharacterized protein
MPQEMGEIPPELPRTEAVQAGRPWGPWATLGWFIVIAGASLFAQMLAAGVVAAIAVLRGEKVDPQTIASDGNVLALGICGSAVAAFGLSILFAWLRKGISLREYLALRLPSKREFWRWLIVLLFFAAVCDALSALLGKPLVPDVMVEIYESADWALPFLWFALLIGAPFSEEFLFRGFLFAGLRQSRVGGVGAIVITAALWAAIHVQYDLYGIGIIFFFGLLLGLVRLKTASLWLCVILHGLLNLIATIQVVIYLAMR